MTTDHRAEAGRTADVAAIRARLEALRDLPWSWRVTDDRRWAVVEDANGDRRAQVNDDDVAEFIAHAPADIAALLAERDALAQRLATLETAYADCDADLLRALSERDTERDALAATMQQLARVREAIDKVDQTKSATIMVSAVETALGGEDR